LDHVDDIECDPLEIQIKNKVSSSQSDKEIKTELKKRGNDLKWIRCIMNKPFVFIAISCGHFLEYLGDPYEAHSNYQLQLQYAPSRYRATKTCILIQR
jgi:hypothetical protein